MNLKTIFITTLAFSLGACSFQKDGEKDKGAPSDVMEQIQKEREKQAFNGQLNESNVKIEFFESEVGTYLMRISWPASIPKTQISINGVREIILGKSEKEIFVNHSKKQDVTIEAFDALGSPISVFQTQVVSPTDLIVDKDLNLFKDELIDVQRVYFYPGFGIRTNGFHLSISTKTLFLGSQSDIGKFSFVSEANIITMVPKNIATNVEQLRNSSITINAKKAVGTLRVALIGANGRDGRSGAELEKEKNISRGLDPQLAGAKGADEVATIGLSADGRNEKMCRKGAQNGQNGMKGRDGHSGEDGQNGGSTGSLIVMVEDHSDFALEVATLPGAPGRGGEGAPGHPGGLGGAPGDSKQGLCVDSSKARAGAQGPKGSDGARGKDGQPGKVGTIESNVGKQKIFDLSLVGF